MNKTGLWPTLLNALFCIDFYYIFGRLFKKGRKLYALRTKFLCIDWNLGLTYEAQIG